MKNNLKWVKIVLAASLALNLAFAASYVYNKFLHKSTWKKEKKIQLEEGLNLDKEQKKKIDAVIRTFKLNMWDYKQDMLEKRIAIIDELGDPEFDPDTITTRTNELNKLENDLNLLFVDTLTRINALLEPEQRLNFLYKLSKNWFFIDRRKHKPSNRKRR